MSAMLLRAVRPVLTGAKLSGNKRIAASLWTTSDSPLRFAPLAFILMLATATPLLLPQLQMLIDLPAHMARYHVEDAIQGSPYLSRWFTYEWRYLPNLGIDLLVALLTPMVDVETATRWAVASIPALATLGILSVAREAHGRVPATALFALPLVYAYPLTFGFVNSCFAVSLALIGFGLWLNLSRRDRPVLRAAVFTVVAPIVLTAHIIGFGVLALCCCGSLLVIEWARARSLWRFLTTMIVHSLPVIWPLIILLAWRTGDSASFAGWLDWTLRAQWLLIALRESHAPLDIASLAIVLSIIALPIVRSSSFGAAPQVTIPALLVWVAALFLPTRMMGSEFAATRLVPAALVLTVLAVRPVRFSWPMATLALALLGIRLTFSAMTLVEADRAAAMELSALDHVARGSRVLAVHYVPCPRTWAPPRTLHLASMATVRRDAMVNDQFVAAAGQLMALTPRVDPRLMASTTVVSAAGCARWPTSLPAVAAHVPWDAIDYLWLIHAPAAAFRVPANAKRVWSHGSSSLYAIAR